MNKSADKLMAATQLKDWCVAIMDFLKEVAPSPFFEAAYHGIIAAHQRGDLRGLRLASKDLVEWANQLPVAQKESLEQVLISQFGRGLTTESQKKQTEIMSILKRGSIADDDQYRLLRSCVERIPIAKSMQPELEQIRSLLNKYELKKCGGSC